MPKRTVYFQENLEHKILRHSWRNSKVSVKVQSDSLYLFSKPGQNYIKGSDIFSVLLIFYTSLNSIFGRKSQNSQLEMNFSSIQLNFEGDIYSTYGVIVFLVGTTISGPRDRTIKKTVKNDSQSQMAPRRRSLSVRVKK